MRLQLTWMVALFFATLQFSFAQEKSISGTVTDESGIPLPGVAILVKGSSKGTQTDFDGNYQISVKEGKTLVFSYVGMKTAERKVEASNTINVVLKVDAKELDEVIVVAYGTTKKSTFTGSASEVKATQLENMTTPSFTEALQGNASGLQVNSSSGDPGSGAKIRIRGIGSLNADSGPLYVVDGMVISSGNTSQLYDKDYPDDLSPMDALSSINPSDIESVTILKDASATSIYGARAANGVVIITTKKGKKGRINISFDTKFGFSHLPNRRYSLMNSEDYYSLYFNAYLSQGLDSDKANAKTISALAGNNPYNIVSPLNNSAKPVGDALLITNTNWIDEVFRTGFNKEYNLSASGGTESTSYFVSLGYSDQEGIIGGTDFQRISSRVNLETKLSRKIKIGTNTSLTYSEQNRASASTAGASSTRNALTYPNAVSVYELDKLGNPKFDKKGKKIFNFKNPVSLDFNPLYTVNHDIYNTKNYRVLSGLFLDVDLSSILEGLSFRSDESIDFYTIDDFQFYNPFHGNGPSVGGRGYKYGTWNTFWTTSNKVTYDKRVSNHHFNFLVGFESSKNTERVIFAHATSYAIYGDIVLNELANASSPKDATSRTNKWSMLSYLARLNYDLENKYYLSFSWRRDGSSRFSSDNRFGDFYSAGTSWRISKESFIEDNINWINDLKIRLSYGTSGNDQIGLYDYLVQFSTWKYDGKPGLALYKPGNPNLGWEKNTSFTIGADFSLFNRKLSGSLEYYNRLTTDLLYESPISLLSGFDNVTLNSASMRNSGFELQLSSTLLENNSFSWTLGFNITKNVNEIVDLNVEKEIRDSKIWKKGGSMYDFYLLKWAGVDESNGNPLWYKKEIDTSGKETGKLITTNDVNKADRFVVGSSQPDFYGGIQTELTYKGISLATNVYFSIGGKILDGVEPEILNDGNKLGFQLSNKQKNSWTPSNKKTNVPKFIPETGNKSNYNLSDRYLYDGTYAKLKSLTLSYRFSKNILEAIRLSNVSVYLSGNNLLTWVKDKNFEGFDPEVGLNGITGYVTPNPTSWTCGVKINF